MRVRVTFYNAFDYMDFMAGKIPLREVRSVEVEAEVELGASYSALPRDLVENIGLTAVQEVRREVDGRRETIQLTAAAVKLEDRTALCPLIIRERESTPVVGAIVLDNMGYRVDPNTGKITKGPPLL